MYQCALIDIFIHLYYIFIICIYIFFLPSRLELDRLWLADPVRARPGGLHPPHRPAVPHAAIHLRHRHRSRGRRRHVLHGLGPAVLGLDVLLEYLQEHLQEAGEGRCQQEKRIGSWKNNFLMLCLRTVNHVQLSHNNDVIMTPPRNVLVLRPSLCEGIACVRKGRSQNPLHYTENNKGSYRVLSKPSWFYEEPSTTEEPFFRLRHFYRFFEEFFRKWFFREHWFERFFEEP